MYARPHLLEIDHTPPTGLPSFRARVGHVHAAGPLVKVELSTASGALIHAELTQERYRHLRLQPGMDVFVHMKDMRIFTDIQNMFGEGI